MKTTINREELVRFGSIELLAKSVVEGFITGNHKSPFHGFSVEFAEHRLYNKGESTRHVDWKLYARTEKLFTKKYEEETNLRCQMVLDCSSSMFFQSGENLSKLEYSIIAIASLIELLKRQRDAIGLSLFSNQLDLHTEAKSSIRHHRYLYSELEKQMQGQGTSNQKKGSAVQALHDIAELCHRRSLIMIFSDMLDDPDRKDELFQAIQHLKHNKHEVILFHVVDKNLEVDFNLENRPYTLVDMETGEKMKLQPGEIKSHYTAQIQAYFKSIADTCTNYRIDFVPTDVNESPESVLSRYLIKRDKMR